ncbi:MAG: pyridoxamine 5'-phosphate oxidase family protein [Candidatus Micrarchaeota archaeon]|nr:pyridoxamine 5'-phosphate oxidase family protein [Candidatus Micrarchaeota archaeon]
MDKNAETAIAKKMIREMLYITLATSDKKAIPWNTPVFYACDRDYNFYWISSQVCVHSVNIEENENVALVIYDSRVPEGKGVGVYIKAKARLVTDNVEIAKAITLLYRKKGKPAPRLSEFNEGAPRRVYVATPVTVWVNDLKAKGGEEFRYLRLEIQLK